MLQFYRNLNVNVNLGVQKDCLLLEGILIHLGFDDSQQKTLQQPLPLITQAI